MPGSKTIERGDDVVEGLEVVHAVGAAAEFSGSLGSAKEKDAEDGNLATIEVEDFLEAVLVLGDAAIGAAGRASETLLLQRGERIRNRIFVEEHYGLAIIFLIASVDQRVQGERVVVGRGDVFFD